MSYTGKNPKFNSVKLTAQAADPVNPSEGDIFRADGTSRRKGLWEYRDGSWQPFDSFSSQNFIINGNMDIRQRTTVNTPTAPSLTTTATYEVIDRFLFSRSGSGTGTIDYSESVLPANNLSLVSALFTANMSATTDKVIAAQRIESIYAKRLASQTASISLYVKPESARKVDIELYYANAVDNFSAVTSFASTTITITDDNSWQLVKYENISMHANSSNGVEVRLRFHDYSTTGSNRTLYFTQFKLNLGAKAETFSYFGLNVDGERRACQRYFFASGEQVGYQSATHVMVARTTSVIASQISIPSRMRTTPTGSMPTTVGVLAIKTDTQGLINGLSFSTVAYTASSQSDSIAFAVTKTTAFTGNHVYIMDSLDIYLDAEL